jgi:hypothetical protein
LTTNGAIASIEAVDPVCEFTCQVECAEFSHLNTLIELKAWVEKPKLAEDGRWVALTFMSAEPEPSMRTRWRAKKPYYGLNSFHCLQSAIDNTLAEFTDLYLGISTHSAEEAMEKSELPLDRSMALLIHHLDKNMYSEALELALSMAAKGIHSAQSSAAGLLFCGFGAPADYTKALQLYEEAANGLCSIGADNLLVQLVHEAGVSPGRIEQLKEIARTYGVDAERWHETGPPKIRDSHQ